MHRSRLLELPAEIQLIICEYVLYSPTPIMMNDDSGPRIRFRYLSHNHITSSVYRPPALTQVNRLLRYTTLKLHYTINRFVASCEFAHTRNYRAARITLWLQLMGPLHRARLGGLTIYDRNILNLHGGVKGYRATYDDTYLLLLRFKLEQMGGVLTREYPTAHFFQVTFPEP